MAPLKNMAKWQGGKTAKRQLPFSRLAVLLL